LIWSFKPHHSCTIMTPARRQLYAGTAKAAETVAAACGLGGSTVCKAGRRLSDAHRIGQERGPRRSPAMLVRT